MYPLPSEKLSFKTFLAEEKTLPSGWDFKMEYFFASVKFSDTLVGKTMNSNVPTRAAPARPGKLTGGLAPDSDPEKTQCLVRSRHSAADFKCHIYSYHLSFFLL